MNALEVNNIKVGYNNHLVIDDFTVSIPKNKITTIIGLMVVESLP